MRNFAKVAVLLSGLAAAGGAASEQLNVSKIATGTETAVDWSELAQPAVSGATLGYATVATAGAEPDNALWFGPTPWTSAPAPAPAYPKVSRTAKLADYSQGGADFHYEKAFTSNAVADMKAAAPKPVRVEAYKSGGGVAAVSYRVRIDHTSAKPLDYFLVLSVPTMEQKTAPGFDLCCAGDSNGGTYGYHRPKSAKARAAVDVYADDLPVWSSEAAYRYPETPNGSPFDHLEIAWDKAAGPGQTTLYLGRLGAGASLTVTVVARAEVRAVGDCGTQHTGWGNDYDLHCLYVRQSLGLEGGANGAPVAFTLSARTPKP